MYAVTLVNPIRSVDQADTYINSVGPDDITKTRLFKYLEKFTAKNWKFSDVKPLIFFIFLLKT